VPALAERVAAKQELDRRECAANAATFTERHCTIEDPDGTVRPFALWDFQADTLRDLQAGEQIIVLKARRLGLSWVVLAFALWLAIHRQGIRILILCKTGDDAGELLDRIRRMRDRIAADPLSAHVLANLHAPAKTRDAVTTLDIGGSTIRALMGTPAAARSETAGFVILDEFAFQRQAADIWQAILPTIEGGGGVALVSTGNGGEKSGGIGAQFAALWSQACSGASGLKPLFFPWMVRPDRDQEWKRRTIAALGDLDRFRMEYPEVPDDAFVAPDTEFVYDHAGIDAAERLGRQLDQQRRAGTIPPPLGEGIQLGIDWGLGSTHMLIVWQLAGGGIYIPPGEIESSRGEPSALTRQALDAAARYDHPLVQARYDQAGGQQMKTFASIAPDEVTIYAVNFGKRKKRTVGFLRELFNRTAQGLDHRIIAISPENTRLLEQLRGLQLDDRGEIVKRDDHGPDALIAGAAPVALAFPSTSPED
jgi:hypothetical protein